MTSETYTIVGVSTIPAGLVKFRVANGSAEARAKVLTRGGHTNVDLITLDSPMSKEAAVAHYVGLHPELAALAAPKEKPETKAKEPKASKETLVDSAETLSEGKEREVEPSTEVVAEAA
jgi:hypothetical protein